MCLIGFCLRKCVDECGGEDDEVGGDDKLEVFV